MTEINENNENGRRCTIDGLPIVSVATTEVFARDLSRNLCRDGHERGRTFCNEFAIRVREENPNLVTLYTDFKDNCLLHPNGPKIGISTVYMLGFIMGYEGLRRQGEVNKIEDSL